MLSDVQISFLKDYFENDNFNDALSDWFQLCGRYQSSSSALGPNSKSIIVSMRPVHPS